MILMIKKILLLKMIENEDSSIDNDENDDFIGGVEKTVTDDTNL